MGTGLKDVHIDLVGYVSVFRGSTNKKHIVSYHLLMNLNSCILLYPYNMLYVMCMDLWPKTGAILAVACTNEIIPYKFYG